MVIMEMIEDLIWSVKSSKLGFVALILKQGEKYSGDLADLKQSDIDYIKALYPSFDEDMKTEETDRIFAIING